MVVRIERSMESLYESGDDIIGAVADTVFGGGGSEPMCMKFSGSGLETDRYRHPE